ncbi:MAG: Glyceraldehyde-3-phosphate dehydrogenase, type I, partial [Berkelbacteria bacterium GW2011_GWB1_38_5]
MKIAINGFGRIGRTFFRAAFAENLEIVAINDLGDLKTLAHLLKYDSNYGKFESEIVVQNDSLQIGNKTIKMLSEKDPANLPWKDLGVDLVIESTGVFTTYDSASKHITAGAKNVIVTAPCKGAPTQGSESRHEVVGKEKIKTIVLGINEEEFDPANKVISMASCTTNALAPVADVLHKNFKILKSTMTTIHSYTMDQRLQDDAHKDLRRARAAALSIIPTTTGATVAATEVLPDLKDKMDGISYRVPTATVSLLEFVALLEKNTTKEEINEAFKKSASDPKYQEAIDVSAEPLVSTDFKGNPHGAIVDLLSTQVVDGNLVRVVAWYDNEMGYSYRLVKFCQYINNK